MSPVFQSLGELGVHAADHGLEIVDAGMPLTQWDANQYGPSWKSQPSIRKVVGFVARHVASTPLHVFERVSDTDRKRLTDGPVADLIRRPSRAPGQTPMRFWQAALIDGLIHDRICLQIVPHADGWELVRIPARLVRFGSDALDRIEEVRITIDGRTVERDPADFLIDTGYAERGANGTSPLTTLREVLEEQNEAVRYRRDIWKRGARFQSVIERPGERPWTDSGAERFKRDWQAFQRGGSEAGSTPVLEDGMTLKEINGIRPKDMLDLEGRRLSDVEVASAYFIPPELLGIREGTFANLQAFRQMLYGTALGPYFEAWSQMLNATLVPRLATGGQRLYIEPNIESKLKGSFEEEADTLSTATGAPWMTRNEARARKNLPAIDGGDELVTPLNVLVGGQASPQDGKAQAVLAKFAERQAQVVRSAKTFDTERWQRELAADLLGAGQSLERAVAIATEHNQAAKAAFDEEEARDAHEDR